MLILLQKSPKKKKKKHSRSDHSHRREKKSKTPWLDSAVSEKSPTHRSLSKRTRSSHEKSPTHPPHSKKSKDIENLQAKEAKSRATASKTPEKDSKKSDDTKRLLDDRKRKGFNDTNDGKVRSTATSDGAKKNKIDETCVKNNIQGDKTVNSVLNMIPRAVNKTITKDESTLKNADDHIDLKDIPLPSRKKLSARRTSNRLRTFIEQTVTSTPPNSLKKPSESLSQSKAATEEKDKSQAEADASLILLDSPVASQKDVTDSSVIVLDSSVIDLCTPPASRSRVESDADKAIGTTSATQVSTPTGKTVKYFPHLPKGKAGMNEANSLKKDKSDDSISIRKDNENDKANSNINKGSKSTAKPESSILLNLNNSSDEKELQTAKVFKSFTIPKKPHQSVLKPATKSTKVKVAAVEQPKQVRI